MNEVSDRMIGTRLLRNGILAIASSVALACSVATEEMKYEVIFEDEFTGDLSAWKVEQQPGGSVFIEEGKLVIADEKGCTVWLREALEGPLRIRYAVTVSSKGRVSDMNCFWMASDPEHEDDLFWDGHGREGAFAQYDRLQLYYVGYGGNHNGTTRFRRYLGLGEKPLLEGYDLREEAYLLEPDRRYEIELVADKDGARYYRDGELVFEYAEEEPLMRGWFGFRTVWSRLEIEDFRVERLLVAEEEG